jgi:hypothetical protein
MLARLRELFGALFGVVRIRLRGLPKTATTLPADAVLPQTPDTLVLRTDFSDDRAWEAVCDEIRRSSCEGFVERYTCVSDPAWADLPVDNLTSFSAPPDFYLAVDRMTLEHPDHPVLAVNLCEGEEGPRTFRLIPAQASGLAANMNTANMYFFEFAESADPDGIFRGFRS